jgi:hypothetical protein
MNQFGPCLQDLPLQWLCLSGLGVLNPRGEPEKPKQPLGLTDDIVEAALPARMLLAYERAHPMGYCNPMNIAPIPDLVHRLCAPAGENPVRCPW